MNCDSAYMMQLWQQSLKSAQKLPNLDGRFRTLVPEYYLNLIDPNDPADPIARMALPSADELKVSAQDLLDPIGDKVHLAAPRLTHRYPDRALLHVTNNCSMYCRFCFRKNLMNEVEEDLYSGDFAPALAYLQKHPEIEELILSGGDPWVLSDNKLKELLEFFAQGLPRLKRLRFHTRVPVTLPSRVTPGLIDALNVGKMPWLTFVVTHYNHPRELTPEAQAAIELLRGSGIVLLNQSVLLKGVNDSAEILRELFVGLGNWGVLPYYLHHCDRVAGAEHFRINLSQGRKIWQQLRGTLPGYLLPEYVLEVPGGGGKIPVGPEVLSQTEAGFVLNGPISQSLYREN
jgi:lysine 2,3-aminomutase